MIEWRSSRLETRLTALDELKEQREDLQTTIDELKESIEEKRTAYHQALDQLQIGLIQLQERLKREAIDYLNELANEFRRHRTNQISATIQRAIHENFHLNEQIVHLTEQLDKSIEINRKASADKDDLTLTVPIREDVQVQSAKKHLTIEHLRHRILSNRVEPTPTNAVEQRSPPRETVLVKEEKKTPVNDSFTSPFKEENDLLRDIIDWAAIAIVHFIQVVFYLQLQLVRLFD